MNAKSAILKKIKDGDFALMTDVRMAERLHLSKRETLGLRDLLMSLCREGELLRDVRGRYGTAQQFGAQKGTFRGNERGYGFFTPDSGAPDLFIPHHAAFGALHGDIVLACARTARTDGEGEILAVIRHGITELVGTYRKEGRAGFVRPDERKYTQEIFIPAGKNKGCADHSKVVVKINPYPGNAPTGEVVEVLGEKGDFFTEELSLIRAHSLREEFPDEVLKEARRQASSIPSPADLKNRVDFRKELIITVDGEDTRDIDDAISVIGHDGVFELGVHIADVSHYVTHGGVLDKEAFARGTSVYFPDRVLPMLPKELSNGICSLNEGEDRLTLSCLMTVDKRGAVLKKRILPSVICSRHRMTYTEVTKIYEGDRAAREKYPDLIEMIDTAMELTKILMRAREKRGSVSMDIKEAKILYADGKISIPDYERTISHEMIEQFMVLANESVASVMTDKKMPFVYRVHESPSEEKAQEFSSFLKELGIGVKFDARSVRPTDYRNLLEELKTSPYYSIVNRVMLRSMMKAVYSPENIGHFGLASDCYCHFTSPIRRYPDLCIHRIIHESFSRPTETKAKYKDVVGVAADQASKCERNALEAERDVDALYIVKYMQDKIGEEYDAVISGMNAYGLFAELKNTVEGFIPIEALPDDYYELFENRYLLKGTRNSYALGQSVRVKVAGVDWGARRTQFVLVTK